jgi:hypothetical protein
MILSQTNKQTLATYCATGSKVYEVAYDPTIVGTKGGTSTPEADAIAAGLNQWYKESHANLIEVIYTSTIAPAHV